MCSPILNYYDKRLLLCREVNVGYASGIMVLAVTNTGEPGYSLYIPSEFALQIYDNLMKVFYKYSDNMQRKKLK